MRIFGVIFSLVGGFFFPVALFAQVIFSPVRPANSVQRASGYSISHLEPDVSRPTSWNVASVKSSATVPTPVSSLPEKAPPVPAEATNAYLEKLIDSLDALRAQAPQRLARRPAETRKERSAAWIERLRGIPAIVPFRLTTLSEFRISSAFGLRYHPVLGVVRNHAGIDLPRREGEAVYATADGVVSQVSLQPDGLGLAVYLRHQAGFETIYGHLSAYRVEPGETVTRGQIIGQVGQTGMATGPHLHYSVLHRGVALNPERFCYLLLQKLSVTGKRNEGRKKG